MASGGWWAVVATFHEDETGEKHEWFFGPYRDQTKAAKASKRLQKISAEVGLFKGAGYWSFGERRLRSEEEAEATFR